MKKQDIVELTAQLLQEMSPGEQEAMAWVTEHLDEIELIVSGEAVSPDTLEGIIDKFRNQGLYKLAAVVAYKLQRDRARIAE